MKGTLLVEESTFTDVSRLPLEGFYRSPHLSLHAHCQQKCQFCKNDVSLVAVGQ